MGRRDQLTMTEEGYANMGRPTYRNQKRLPTGDEEAQDMPLNSKLGQKTAEDVIVVCKNAVMAIPTQIRINMAFLGMKEDGQVV